MKLVKKFFSKKFILFLLVFSLSLGVFLTQGQKARAASTTTTTNTNPLYSIPAYSVINPPASVWSQAILSPNSNVSQWTYGRMGDTIRALTDFLIPIYTIQGALQQNIKLTPYNAPGSLLKSLSFNLDAIYSYKAISGVSYLAYLKDNALGVIQPSYALGKGSDMVLNPILYIWTIFRDLSYVFFVIIFVAIGFMVMFRFKINPQTVASIQDTIPRLAVSLILVTLSYAIAGLFVDIAFVGNTLMENVLTQGNNGIHKCILNSQALGNCVQWDYAYGTTAIIDKGIPDHPTQPSAFPIDILNTFGGSGTGVFSGVANVFAVGIMTLLGSLVGISNVWEAIFALAVAFTVVGTVFKIFFSVLAKYIQILLTTVFLPIGILWGTLPGQEDTTPKMMRTMLSACITFPAVMALLAIAAYFSDATLGAKFAFTTIPPLYIPGTTQPVTLAGQTITLTFQLFIALGILMLVAQVPDAIDEALQVRSTGAGAAGEALGGALRKIPIIGSVFG